MTISAHETAALPLTISRASVVHFLGYPEGQEPPPRVAGIIDDVLREARTLVRGVGTYELLEVSSAPSVGLEIMEAKALVVGLVTIGDALEKRVSEWIANGAATRALVLDAAGSAAAEEAANRLGGIIGDSDPSDTHHVPCRISPGYGRWRLDSQTLLFGLLRHEEVGVTLLPSMLMSPRKSISFAMWLGADARPIAGLSGCAACELETCRYRKADVR